MRIIPTAAIVLCSLAFFVRTTDATPDLWLKRSITKTVTVFQDSTTVPAKTTPLPHPSTPGPLITCYETITSAKNWFTISWKSGERKDIATCKSLRDLIKQQSVKLSGFKCFWYWDSMDEEGVTKAYGILGRQEGIMSSALAEPVEKLWGRGKAKWWCKLE